MVERICQYCDKKFMTHSSHMRKYCSKKCYTDSKGSIEKECEICNKKFIVWQSHVKKGHGRYCSRKCMARGMNKSIKKKCEYCGKEFMVWPSEIKKAHKKNHEVKYRSKICMGKGQIIHVGGQKFLKWNRAKARKLALEVFKHECVLCGGSNDHVHHKDCDPLNGTITNLVFLCHICHWDVHREIKERAKCS